MASQKAIAFALLALLSLLVACLNVCAADYIDSFDDAPFAGNPTAFTTGEPSRGLSYVGANCDFGYSAGGKNVNSLAIVML